MGLEHFGSAVSWQQLGKRGGDDSASRAATDKNTASPGAENDSPDHLHTNRARQQRKEEDEILSKLTGISRSVSWGRGTANQRQLTHQRDRSDPQIQKQSTLKPHGTQHKRGISHGSFTPFKPSLSKLAPLPPPPPFRPSSPVSPSSTDREPSEPLTPTAGPSSAAALSLRSLSGSGESTPRQSHPTPSSASVLSSLQLPDEDSLSDTSSAVTTVISSPRHTGASQSSPPVSSADKSEWASLLPAATRATVHVPLVRVNELRPSQASGAQSSPGTPPLCSPAPHRAAEALKRPSLPDLELASEGPVRRHHGSFMARMSSSTELSSSASHSLDEDGGTPPPRDSRAKARFRRLFMRVFQDSRQSSSSESATPQSLSPPLVPTKAPQSITQQLSHDRLRSQSFGHHSALPPPPYTKSQAQALRRPPKSPLMCPIPAPDLGLADDDEIHGLTTRSTTPARVQSPSPVTTVAATHMNDVAMAALKLTEQQGLHDVHTINAYEIGEDIGSGAYGFVRRARLKGTTEELVIKYIVKSSIFADSWRRHRVYGTIPGEIFILLQLQHTPYTPPAKAPAYVIDKRAWERERDMYLAQQQNGSALGHPGICKLVDFFEDDEYYYMVMPKFGDGQDLFDFVESSLYGIELRDIRSFLGQVADVMAFMHGKGIVHRDIKDENVILDARGRIQLIDFGSAARVQPGRLFDTFSGTMDYAAVEILHGEKYAGPPQDVWAFGVVAYVLVCGECPYADIQEASHGLAPGTRAYSSLQHFCFQCDTPVTEPSSSDSTPGDRAPHSFARAPPRDSFDSVSENNDGGGLRSQLFDLICQCLQNEPDDRPTAQDILHHAFLDGAGGWTGPRGWTTT